MSVSALRPAATVVMIDPQHRILLVQRNKEMKFFGGAYAFPGGRVEPGDVGGNAGEDVWAGHVQAPAGLDFCTDRGTLFTAYETAARREAREETNLRVEGPLLPWARWITPEPEPKRYDTLFFLARAAEAPDVRVDGLEAVAHRWLTASEALALAKTGEIILPPPTFVTLTELAFYQDWVTLERVQRQFGTPEVFPRVLPTGDKLYLTLPDIPRSWPPGMPTRAEITLTAEGVRAKF